MQLREMRFNVLPAEAILVDIVRREYDVPAEAVARMIYQAGLRALDLDDVRLGEVPTLRQDLIQEGLDRQMNQTTAESKYVYTGTEEALDEVCTPPTVKEMEATYQAAVS